MRDDVSWLGSLVEPPRERNARVWTAATAAAPITPVGEVKNSATLADGHGSDREDVRAAFAARREAREAAAASRSARAAKAVDEIIQEHARDRRLDVLRAALARGDEPEQIRAAWPTWWAVGNSSATERQWHRDLAEVRAESAPAAQETTMAKRVVSTTEDKQARREALREYLREHGPTTRGGLIEALGYPEGERGYYQLRTDCEAIGAGSETRQGPVALADRSHEPVPRPRRKPRTALSETPAPTKRRPAPEAAVPVRPSLAAAAREALRQADREGAPLYLEHEFVAALHGRLVEAGL